MTIIKSSNLGQDFFTAYLTVLLPVEGEEGRCGGVRMILKLAQNEMLWFSLKKDASKKDMLHFAVVLHWVFPFFPFTIFSS